MLRTSGICISVTSRRGYRVMFTLPYLHNKEQEWLNIVLLLEASIEAQNGKICHGIDFLFSNKKLLTEWLVNLRRENTPKTKHSYVCSEHFDSVSFTKPLGGHRIRLKPGSVPTKFIFSVKKPERL